MVSRGEVPAGDVEERHAVASMGPRLVSRGGNRHARLPDVQILASMGPRLISRGGCLSASDLLPSPSDGGVECGSKQS